MNYNQKILERALREEMVKANITYNKYREILDACLDALEESDETSEPTQAGLKGKFKNLIQYSIKAKPGNVKFEPFVPMGDIVKPEPMEVLYVGDEWLFEKANEFKQNVLGMIREDYENNRITFEDYADKVAKLNVWRMAMNSKKKQPTVQGEIKYERLEGAKFIREPDGKDEYAEISARLNEIADKVNAIYAAVNKLKEPVVNKANTTINYTGGQLTEEQTKEMINTIQNNLVKSIRETRLKGGFK